MYGAIVLIIAAFGQTSLDPAQFPAPAAAASTPAGDPVIDGLVHAQNDVRVFAEVEGLLTTLNVREGSRVSAGQVIATIDDRHAQAAVDVARIGFQAADERAKDEIEKVFARLSAEVAQKDYQMSLQANASGMKVVSEIELEKKRLDWNRARLQIEKAEKDRVLARLEANVKQAELDAAEIAMDRRTIAAPFDGEVQLVLLHDSEWVNPGDPILRLVQFDVMYVEGYVRADRFDPAELQGRPVTVTVKQARNRQVAIPGHVRWVNQTVVDTTEGYAEYLVQAEVKNTREGEFWLVRPGIRAALTVHVNQPPVTQSAVPPTAQR